MDAARTSRSTAPILLLRLAFLIYASSSRAHCSRLNSLSRARIFSRFRKRFVALYFLRRSGFSSSHSFLFSRTSSRAWYSLRYALCFSRYSGFCIRALALAMCLAFCSSSVNLLGGPGFFFSQGAFRLAALIASLFAAYQILKYAFCFSRYAGSARRTAATRRSRSRLRTSASSSDSIFLRALTGTRLRQEKSLLSGMTTSGGLRYATNPSARRKPHRLHLSGGSIVGCASSVLWSDTLDYSRRFSFPWCCRRIRGTHAGTGH